MKNSKSDKGFLMNSFITFEKIMVKNICTKCIITFVDENSARFTFEMNNKNFTILLTEEDPSNIQSREACIIKKEKGEMDIVELNVCSEASLKTAHKILDYLK